MGACQTSEVIEGESYKNHKNKKKGNYSEEPSNSLIEEQKMEFPDMPEWDGDRYTGIGIKKEKLDKVFERFYREDEARNSTSGGYGLGLAIASEVVARHHGIIRCESEYGKWVKFIVVLP